MREPKLIARIRATTPSPVAAVCVTTARLLPALTLRYASMERPSVSGAASIYASRTERG